jgi:hypothetical protein
MNSSTAVDKFDPHPGWFVDKLAILGRSVDKPVNERPERALSTALSTMLITYTRVVQDVFGTF